MNKQACIAPPRPRQTPLRTRPDGDCDETESERVACDRLRCASPACGGGWVRAARCCVPVYGPVRPCTCMCASPVRCWIPLTAVPAIAHPHGVTPHTTHACTVPCTLMWYGVWVCGSVFVTLRAISYYSFIQLYQYCQYSVAHPWSMVHDR